MKPVRGDDEKEERRKDPFREKYKDQQDHMKLARALSKVEAELEAHEAEGKKMRAEYDVLRIEILPDLFDQKGLENQTLDGLSRYDEESGKIITITGRISLTADMFVSVPKGNKDKLFGWLKKMKLGDLITPNVNSSTLKAFIKERTKAGKAVPPEGILKVTPYTRATITKV